MSKDFLPHRETELVIWSANFSRKIALAPQGYGLTVAQAQAYGAVHDAFATAHQVANNPDTRSPSNIVAKNLALAALIAETRMLARIVRATPTVTDEQRLALGLTVRNVDASPIPVPQVSPQIAIIERIGTLVRIRLHDGSQTHRGKPAGVQGASLFSFVGATPPTDVHGWKFECNTTRTVMDVLFDQSLVPGTIVWFTAFWYNPRGQHGLGGSPVSAILAGGGMMKHAA